MIDKAKKQGKLSYEILAIFAICFIISLFLYFFLSYFGSGLVEEYCFNNDIYLDEYQLYQLDSSIFVISLIVSVVFFIILFFSLFGERLAYIRTIISGVEALRHGNFGQKVELSGNNELTQLAETINYLSANEQKIKEKEKRLNKEKEELVRMLSHDIRTPLTSIMSYTELLGKKECLTIEEQKDYLAMVGKQALQIKTLTDILLDGGKREPEFFEDARLLMTQLADEFEEMLEEDFSLLIDLSELPEFSGCFDVREMRRIFNNLISNVQKYAVATVPVELSISKDNEGVVIRQKNDIGANNENPESYRIGINSIRRIAHNYDGNVDVIQDLSKFEIIITLSKI